MAEAQLLDLALQLGDLSAKPRHLCGVFLGISHARPPLSPYIATLAADSAGHDGSPVAPVGLLPPQRR
jgi:hypothetical protein